MHLCGLCCRYRIVPSCYRRSFPPHLKSHRSHDIVLLCVDCHQAAHKAAERLKRQLANELGVPLLPPNAVIMAAPTAAPVPAAAAAGEAGDATAACSTSALDSGGAENGNLEPGSSSSTSIADAAADDSCSADCDVIAAAVDESNESLELPITSEATVSATSSDGSSSVTLFKARAAATALRRFGDHIPQPRKQELESVLKIFLGRDPSIDPPGLQPGDLEMGILAGLGARKRHKAIKKMKLAVGNGQGIDVGREPAGELGKGLGSSSAGEGESNVPAGEGSGGGMGVISGANIIPSPHPISTLFGFNYLPFGPPKSKQEVGHAWHGEKLVAKVLEEEGEEGLHKLVRKFRACFVAACRPRYLPSEWAVDVIGVREFGDYSVYAKNDTAVDSSGADARCHITEPAAAAEGTTFGTNGFIPAAAGDGIADVSSGLTANVDNAAVQSCSTEQCGAKQGKLVMMV